MRRALSRGRARSCSVGRGAFNSESREHNLRGYNQPTRPDGSALSALTLSAPRRPPPRRATARLARPRPCAPAAWGWGASGATGSFLLACLKKNTKTSKLIVCFSIPLLEIQEKNEIFNFSLHFTCSCLQPVLFLFLEKFLFDLLFLFFLFKI